MKRNEFKQAAWAMKTMQRKRNMLFTRLLIITMVLFCAPAVALAMSGDVPASDAIVMMGSSTALASMALIGDIDDTSDREAAGKQIAYRVWLVEISQIDRNTSFPQPNANREVGTIPLKAGEVMHYFEAHDIPTYDSKGEKGDFTTETTNTFVIAMSGARDALLNFAEDHVGGKFILVYGQCESDLKFIIGNPCKPMILKSFEFADNKEKRALTFTFENNSFLQPHKYVGAITRTEPVTLAAGTSALAIVPGNDVYILPNGSESAVPVTTVSGLTANDKGRTIIVQGTGTDKAATIEDGSAFVLEGGATWTAKAGSSITFRVLDPTRLVEVIGTRVQTA